MTVRIRVGTTIDAPPERVWDVVEAIETHTDWMADAARITFVSSRRRGVGTEFDCVTRLGPFRTTDRMTVTEWEPGRSIGIEHHGIVTGRGCFTLKRKRGDRTRFRWSERLRFPWWMGGPVGERAAKPVLRLVWRGNLRRLRRIAEAPSWTSVTREA
jgi:uncharacterized protein YndB with AHSA1/START domain